ncbi:hypothetical protein BDB01DRAFT_896154 [Pilobolus umbonatus]|nr:hypothetical protein BDB01DRAFT_896154 [Pilobolus umbonatus]
MCPLLTNSYSMVDICSMCVHSMHTNNKTVIVDGARIPSVEGSFGTELPFGFHNLTTYDMGTKEWLQINNASNQDNSNFIFGLTSVYSPATDTSYYFDGSALGRTSNTSQWLALDVVSTVTYPDYVWKTFVCRGLIPTRRDYHTTTLLPDQKNVLVYGGTYNYKQALEDYCYVLSLESKTWSSCKLVLPPGTSGPRYGHSAVLVRDFLFLIFGKDVRGQSTNDMLILNVSNPNNITFTQEYSYAEPIVEVEEEEESKGLSSGAIAGIIIGCLLFLAILMGMFIIYLHKKKKEANRSINEFPADWDQIDKSFQTDNEKTEITEVTEVDILPKLQFNRDSHLTSLYSPTTSPTILPVRYSFDTSVKLSPEVPRHSCFIESNISSQRYSVASSDILTPGQITGGMNKPDQK